MVQPKYFAPKLVKQVEVPVSGNAQKIFIEELENYVVEGDDVLGTFKFNLRNNFKPNVVNTVGIYENFDFFRLLYTVVNKDLAFWFTCAHEPGARARLNQPALEKDEESK